MDIRFHSTHLKYFLFSASNQITVFLESWRARYTRNTKRCADKLWEEMGGGTPGFRKWNFLSPRGMELGFSV